MIKDQEFLTVFHNSEVMAEVARIVRKHRMGKVKRHGRKGHRRYTVTPINFEEMTLTTRKLYEALRKS